MAKQLQFSPAVMATIFGGKTVLVQTTVNKKKAMSDNRLSQSEFNTITDKIKEGFVYGRDLSWED